MAQREAAGLLQQQLGVSERRSCRVLGVGRSLLQYVPRPDRNATLRARLKELAETRRRFGSPRLHILLQREGWTVNHKRVERLYRQEGLSLRRKRRRKSGSHLRVVLPAPSRLNERWSMDFVTDSLVNGRRFRSLTVVDVMPVPVFLSVTVAPGSAPPWLSFTTPEITPFCTCADAFSAPSTSIRVNATRFLLNVIACPPIRQELTWRR